MSNVDLLSMAFRNLIKRKLRTFLTILGVIIGTSAIIVMLSLGFGMSQSFEDQLSQWNDLRLINVYLPYTGDGGGAASGAKPLTLDDDALEVISNMTGVDVAVPLVERSFMVKVGRLQGWLQVRAMDGEDMAKLGYDIEEGRYAEDTDKLSFVAGANVRYNFYNPKSRNYEEVNIDLLNERNIQLLIADEYDNSAAATKYKPQKIKFVGILQSKDWNTDYYCFTPMDELKKLTKLVQDYRKEAYNEKPEVSTGYNSALVKCEDIKTVRVVQAAIKDMGYDAYSPTESLDSMQQTANSIQMLLGAIGGVSLLVAAIGIANTMMMSIYERTREIGIMKVIGASLRDINRLFLTEAALIGIIGGLLGVGMSTLLSYIVNTFGMSFFQSMFGGMEGSKISIIPLWLCGAALLFSALVGILSGYFPARRAMKLSALSAIKTD